MSYLWHEYEDEDLQRMFKKYSVLGTSALPEDLNERLIQAISNMQSNYAKATICDYKDRTKCNLYVEPGKWDPSVIVIVLRQKLLIRNFVTVNFANKLARPSAICIVR